MGVAGNNFNTSTYPAGGNHSPRPPSGQAKVLGRVRGMCLNSNVLSSSGARRNKGALRKSAPFVPPPSSAKGVVSASSPKQRPSRHWVSRGPRTSGGVKGQRPLSTSLFCLAQPHQAVVLLSLPQHAERAMGGVHLAQKVGLGEGAGLADLVSVDGDGPGLDVLLGLAFGRA